MSRMTAPDRLRRLLAVLPWVAGVGGASLDEIADRFDYPRERLERDLVEIVQFVGVYPYTPGDLIEVFIDPDSGRVTINYADYFKSSLRLTPEEALALVGAGAGLVAAAGGDSSEPGPLARGIAKLATQLGVEVGETVDVQLGSGDPEILATMRSAAEHAHVVAIDYYSHGRDSRSRRDIEPVRVFARDGAWYVSGWCRSAEADRVFRLDRIHTAEPKDEQFAPRESTSEDHFAPDPSDPRMVIELDQSAAWVADYYPIEAREEGVDGSIVVTMAVTATSWIERLLLQLGPHARVLSVQNPTGADSAALSMDPTAQSARRVLERYRS